MAIKVDGLGSKWVFSILYIVFKYYILYIMHTERHKDIAKQFPVAP